MKIMIRRLLLNEYIQGVLGNRIGSWLYQMKIMIRRLSLNEYKQGVLGNHIWTSVYIGSRAPFCLCFLFFPQKLSDLSGQIRSCEISLESQSFGVSTHQSPVRVWLSILTYASQLLKHVRLDGRVPGGNVGRIEQMLTPIYRCVCLMNHSTFTFFYIRTLAKTTSS